MTQPSPARWNARYAAGHDLWSRGPHPALPALVPELSMPAGRPPRAVDLGAGEGRNAVWLAQHGWHVEAVDFAEVAVARGLAHSRAVGVEVVWTVADAETWRPQGPIDLLVLCYFHLEDAAFRRSVGWVAPGGYVLVMAHEAAPATPGEEGQGRRGPRDPRFRHTPESLRERAAGLQVVSCDRWPTAGAAAPPAGDGGTDIGRGTSDVVLLARV